MAKGPQPGSQYIIWMIVFAALWLTSTVLLVILYTGQEELREEARRLQAENARLVSPTERNAIPLVQNARSPGPTAVGLLEESRGKTAELAVGDRNADVGAVQEQLTEFLRIIRSDRIVSDAERYNDLSYHRALTNLYESFKAEAALRRGAEDRSARLEGEVEQLTAAMAGQRRDFESRLQELGDQLAEEEAKRSQFRKERNEQVAELEQTFEQWRQQTDADLRRERQQNVALREHVAKLEERLAVLQERFGDVVPGPERLATVRRPDGRILKAIPGDEVVYIDLGRKHRLTLGLRLAVYDPASGIPEDGRAKAQIEVVSIADSSAECRKIWVAPGAVILEDDLIANPIFDPTRATEFVVIGEFDLDHDGETDPQDAVAIEAMILDWGGTVTSEVTALTDFVVIGRAPPTPRMPREQTPELMARYNAMQQAHESYMAIVQQAHSLAVPVLNQKLFLNFLGFGDRVALR